MASERILVDMVFLDLSDKERKGSESRTSSPSTVLGKHFGNQATGTRLSLFLELQLIPPNNGRSPIYCEVIAVHLIVLQNRNNNQNVRSNKPFTPQAQASPH